MDADANGHLIEETVDDVDLVLERLERLQRFAELHLGALAACPPVIAVDAVAHEQHAEALRERACGCRHDVTWHGGLRRVRPGHRFEPRQGHRHAKTAEHRSSRESVVVSHRVSSPLRLFLNCELVTMVSIKLSKRYPSLASFARMASIAMSSESIRLRPSP